MVSTRVEYRNEYLSEETLTNTFEMYFGATLFKAL